MQDFIGLGIIIAILLCGLYGLARISRKEELTDEEYDKRRAQSTGVMTSGIAGSMAGLQELLQPNAAEAIAVQRDLQQGYYNVKQKKASGNSDDDENSHGETTSDEPLTDNQLTTTKY
jgi:hypothetical protein